MLVPIIRTLIITFGGVKIKAVEKKKDLGVIIDKGFTFTEHIATFVKKANQMLGIIKRKN